MTLSRWESLTDEEREMAVASWDIYAPGWWHDLFDDGARELAQRYQSDPTVLRVFRANYHGALEIIIETKADTKCLPGLVNYMGDYRELPVRQTWGPVS